MYRWYQVIICLLKFDFFFFVGVTMQVIDVLVLSRGFYLKYYPISSS